MSNKEDIEPPVLTAEWFAKARPAREVLPARVLAAAKRGRPKASETKEGNLRKLRFLDFAIPETFIFTGLEFSQNRFSEVARSCQYTFFARHSCRFPRNRARLANANQ